ncbi:MAG: Uma2 family endonuclease [Acidobacteriota bacterium]|nr:Uma2 family endonuclease [Acidobacteriota bacterium]
MNTILVKENFVDDVKLNFGSFLKPMKNDDFLQLSRDNQDVQIEMNKDGDLIIMPGTGGLTGKRNIRILRKLDEWTEKDGTGVAFDSDTIFCLPNGAKKIPDASWLSNEKWDALSAEEQDKIVPFAPDFTIELRSRTDSLKDLQEKMQEYIENGVSLGWLIDPSESKVYVYRPEKEVEILGNPKEVSGEPLLKEFTLNLEEICN